MLVKAIALFFTLIIMLIVNMTLFKAFGKLFASRTYNDYIPKK